MRWFVNLKTRSKLYLGFGIVIFLLLVLTLIESRQSNSAMKEYTDALTTYVPLNRAGEDYLLRISRERISMDEYQHRGELSSTEEMTYPQLIEEQRRKMNSSAARFRSSISAARDLANEETSKEIDAIDMLFRKLEKNQDEYLDLLERMPYEESGADLAKLWNSEAFTNNTVEMQESLDLLSYELHNLLDASADRIDTHESNIFWSRVIIFSFGILVVLFFASAISHNIAAPLVMATQIAERLGEGDTTVPIVTDRKDEVGDLLRTLEKLRDNSDLEAQVAVRIADGDLTVEIEPLSEKDVLGMALSRMVDRLRSQIREMIEGINVLATATAELSSTMAQISTGARDTAGAVTETASTLMQVKQASQLSNEKARTISDNAQRTLLVSRDGVSSIEKSIRSMEDIREQMRSIAENIVKLSEQGQAIGEIVTSVNELAEQSNILAVNAAIEAAKAGEYGKGFTVVAREIRNHAEQSKHATSKVRSILTDTQKATASAVFVAERGTKLAEDGAQLSSESGRAIQTVMTGINDTAQSMIQISASAKEQLVGLDQVTTAIQHIKGSSEQNAESIHQVELTAQNLKELGMRLQRFVERYRL